MKIISHEPVKAGEKSALLLKLTNPTGHEMQIKLLQPEDLPPPEEKEEPKSIEKSLEKSLNLEKVRLVFLNIIPLKDLFLRQELWFAIV